MKPNSSEDPQHDAIASQRDPQRWVPWIFQPPRAHGVELELDRPGSAAEFHAIARGLDERGELCECWVFDGRGWRHEALPLSERPREGELRKIARFETFEHEMISSASRADREIDRRDVGARAGARARACVVEAPQADRCSRDTRPDPRRRRST